MPERRRKFSPQYRDEAVKMVTETSRPSAAVAREHGINEDTLANWVAQYRKAHPEEEEPLTISDGLGFGSSSGRTVYWACGRSS